MCKAPSQLPSHWTRSFGKGKSLPEQSARPMMLFVHKCSCHIVPGCCSSFKASIWSPCLRQFWRYVVSLHWSAKVVSQVTLGRCMGGSFGRLRRQSYLVPCKAPVYLFGPVLLANEELKSWKFGDSCVEKDQRSRKTAAHNGRVLWPFFFFLLCLRFSYFYWQLLQFRTELIKLGECTCWIPENESMVNQVAFEMHKWLEWQEKGRKCLAWVCFRSPLNRRFEDWSHICLYTYGG